MNFAIDQIRLFAADDETHNDGLDVGNLAGGARFSRTPQGILLQGNFKGQVSAQCVRCLIDFDQSLATVFSELFAFDERTVTESGLILPEDGNVDLGPLVRDYLLLEVPISSLCRPDCKGLCPECGTDLNRSTCEHQPADNNIPVGRE